MGIRKDGREPDELRPIAFTRDYTELAMGSVLVEMGRTRVLCTASVEERVPPWLRGKGRGWVTAEYSMLPGLDAPSGSTARRREGKQSGRTQEIQRLIGRSLRAVTDLVVLGEVQITVDCDALQADGGTRTAAICGGYLALHDACSRLVAAKQMAAHPITDLCAAISVGVVGALPCLDLDYSEDSDGRGRHERGDDRRRASTSRCRAPPRARRSAAASSTRCSTSPSTASTRSSSCSAS